MRRVELEHVIRAAAAVAEDEEIVVVGSQAILGQFPDAPASMCVSREADVYPRNHPERDWEFAELAIRHGLADPDELRRRVDEMSLDGPRLASLRQTVDGAIARARAAGS